MRWLLCSMTILTFLFGVVEPVCADYLYIGSFGSYGSGPGEFWASYGVAVGSSGNIVVVVSRNEPIPQFSKNGAYLSSFGSAGSGNGQFDEPWNVAIDSSNNIYIADVFNNRIEEFSSAGVFVASYSASADNLLRHAVLRVWTNRATFGLLIRIITALSNLITMVPSSLSSAAWEAERAS